MMTTAAALMGALADRLGLGPRPSCASRWACRGRRIAVLASDSPVHHSVIYLFLDKYSGTGPMTDEQLVALDNKA